MGTVLNSLDNIITQATSKGMLTRCFSSLQNAATSAATVNCGKVLCVRHSNTYTVPSFGAGVTSAYCTYFKGATGTILCMPVMAYEQTLGTLTVSGNVFSAGSAMPTRTIEGTSIVTATVLPMLAVTTAVTGSSPVVTITYENESGTSGRTATLTIPSNTAINSAFLITPHLQSGDSGIRSVSNISISTGSAGVLKVFGLFPLGISLAAVSTGSSTFQFLSSPFPMFPLAASDSIAFYVFGSVSAHHLLAMFSLVGDN